MAMGWTRNLTPISSASGSRGKATYFFPLIPAYIYGRNDTSLIVSIPLIYSNIGFLYPLYALFLWQTLHPPDCPLNLPVFIDEITSSLPVSVLCLFVIFMMVHEFLYKTPYGMLIQPAHSPGRSCGIIGTLIEKAASPQAVLP